MARDRTAACPTDRSKGSFAELVNRLGSSGALFRVIKLFQAFAVAASNAIAFTIESTYAENASGFACGATPFVAAKLLELLIPIHPALARALQAGPVVGMTHIITDARGKPLQRLTKIMAAAVKTAGLPPRCVAHGLRKAALRRLAEAGSTTKQIAAVSGHRSLSEIERYTARADQAGLAQAAIAKLPDEEVE